MFETLIFILIFLMGLIVGSFLNCVIYRLEIASPRPVTAGRGSRSALSFLKGRSFCPSCKHTLNWQDLFPILSFFILKRKCHYCQQKISWQYPLIELATGLIFILIFWFLISGIYLISLTLILKFSYFLIIASFLLIIFVYDLKHYIIPDKVIFPAIFLSGLWYLIAGIFLDLYTKGELLTTIYSALGTGGFFLAIVLLGRGKWMGVGDIKLAFLMGLFLGWPNISVALFLAFFIGSIIGIGLMIAGKKTMKSEVPFGPCLVTGTFLAMFFGKQMLAWYQNLFLL